MTDSNDGDQPDETTMRCFQELLERPEDGLVSLLMQEQHDPAVLRQVCSHLFSQVEVFHSLLNKLHKRDDEDETLAGIDEIHLGDEEEKVEAETIWGQVELQNEALRPLVRKLVKKLSGAAAGDIRLLDLDQVNSREEKEVEDAYDDEESQEESDDDVEDDDDDETLRIKARMERAMANMEDEEGDEELEDSDDEDVDKDGSDDKAGDEMIDPIREGMRDGFFDLHEMEDFADEEEEYLPDLAFGEEKPEKGFAKPKKSFHQRQREGDLEPGSDESDDEDVLLTRKPMVRRKKYRPDDEVDALFTLYESPKSKMNTDDVINMTAADLFGKPDEGAMHRYKKEWRDALPETFDGKDDDDADSWDNHDFDNENGNGWRDEDGSERGEIGGEEDGDDEVIDGKEEMKPAAVDKKPPPNKSSQRLIKQTQDIEKQMLSEKPWFMTGEAKGTARPTNSLIDSTPEFETATKAAPIITVEHSANIEDIIKRRILSEDWDDVVPRELPDVAWNKKRGELPEVSQEKSKLGLGELYEREYLKKAVGYDVDAAEKESEEGKAKEEMKALFASLCSKLDALSNYHFAPRPIADEAEVKAISTPAIAMEEVIPLHVSDARGVAPEEVYGSKKGRDSVVRGDTEMDQAERKRLRNAKKAARRKGRNAKLADEKLLSRLQPGLGLNNPYEKRKMREELQMARASGKVTTGERDENADYGLSSKFFKRMQDEVEHAVKGDDDGSRKRQRTVSSSKSSSSYKL